MKISKWLSFLFCLFTFSLPAQEVTINGSAAEWAEKEVQLMVETDPVTARQAVLDTDSISPEGNFMLRAEIDGTAQLWLIVKRFKAPLFAEPGKNYSINLIPKKQNSLVDTWQNGSFEYVFTDLDSSDVNQTISKFDTDYYRFFVDNQSLIGRRSFQTKVRGFAIDYNLEGSSFAANYIDYSLAEMKLGSGFEKDSLFKYYLKDKRVNLKNPAWYSFFKLFYGDYFQVYDSRFGGATMYNRFKNGLQPDSLNRLLLQDPYLQNDTLRQLVLLKSIDEAYTNPNYPLKSLKAILSDIIASPASNKIAEIAQSLEEKVHFHTRNAIYAELAQKYLINYSVPTDTLPSLIMVSLPWSKQSRKEAAVLKSLKEKYDGLFAISEVSLEPVQEKADRNWPIYEARDPKKLLDALNAYSIPHFIWVNKQGQIEKNPATRPSQGLEKRLFKMKAEKDEREKIRVGGR